MRRRQKVRWGVVECVLVKGGYIKRDEMEMEMEMRVRERYEMI